ncbi:MAG: TrkH family potassium uptake protein [Bacillota bacterium]|jgi:trk system potassium uptake protein TrkH
MRIKLVCWNLGKISIVLGITLLLPIIWAIAGQEDDVSPLFITFVLSMALGSCLMLIFKNARKQTLRQREGFALVTFGWLLASLIGTLPYMLYGMLPDFASAFFESMSGFTTTGATVLNNVEIYPKGLIMWRALTHWLGGMGIVVLIVAISGNSKGTSNLYNAETPGSSHTERLTPKISETSLIMWSTYFVMTIILIVILKIEGMTLFDAFCQAFSTVSTGGFSSRTDSIGAFNSPLIQWTLILFMFFSGANIAYLYFLFVRKKNLYIKSEEFKVYTAIVLIATVVVALILMNFEHFAGESLEFYLREACFQVVSIITTTGFSTQNYEEWPHLAQLILLMMFFIGGCFGSTAGSVKVPRWCIAIKSSFAQLHSSVHPRSVTSVRLNNRTVPEKSISSTVHFILMFMVLTFFGAGLVSLSGFPVYDSLVTSMSCITNVGPTFGAIGAIGSYDIVPAFGKIILSLLMLIGRLEIYTVLVLFLPSVWKK